MCVAECCKMYPVPYTCPPKAATNENTKQEKPEQLSMLDALKDPNYDLYQEQEGDQKILQGLNDRLRHRDDILTDIG